ncbi:DUF5344 family protein [Halobacillus salinus]|uniref:Uncharacterized protein n=1 Tax=Halobacillus salinus TaxID=192814 RepID=A0A4Z0GZ11_9BACI|nr:DUF5344 family protein [Halobacillus salinus]TGB03462.1 hypothetical protein E4663_00195 [Halobacillus salinus]
MSKEIRVRYQDVESSINQIEQSSESFDTQMLQQLKGDNVLEVADQLERINQELKEIGEAYKEILRMNNQAVKTSVQGLEAQDVQLSGQMKR